MHDTLPIHAEFHIPVAGKKRIAAYCRIPNAGEERLQYYRDQEKYYRDHA